MFKKISIELENPIPHHNISELVFHMKKQGVQKIMIDPVYRKKIAVSILEDKYNTDLEKLLKNLIHKYILNSKNRIINKNKRKSIYYYPADVSSLKSSGLISNREDITQNLIDNKWLLLLQSNDFGFQHELLSLFDKFDKLYHKFIGDLFPQYQEIYFSPLISYDFLDKIQLLKNCPATHFFLSEKKLNYSDVHHPDHEISLSPAHQTLQTAPCFKIYAALANKQLTQDQVFSIKGTCFRNEGSTTYFLERLLSFTMREFVFVGSPEFVLHARDKILQNTIKWLDTLEMSTFCQEANDPFFIQNHHENNFNIPPQIKQEIRALLPYKNDSLAIASFDTHGDFFTKHLKFSINNRNTWTGCIGLGLERVTWAFLQQKGLSKQKWPKILQELEYRYEL